MPTESQTAGRVLKEARVSAASRRDAHQPIDDDRINAADRLDDWKARRALLEGQLTRFNKRAFIARQTEWREKYRHESRERSLKEWLKESSRMDQERSLLVHQLKSGEAKAAKLKLHLIEEGQQSRHVFEDILAVLKDIRALLRKEPAP